MAAKDEDGRQQQAADRAKTKYGSYQELATTLAAQIARGTWRPGQALPPAPELAAQHGVAPATIHRALDVLAAKGLVEKVHGGGTYVRRPDFHTAYVRFIRYYGSAGDQRTPGSRLLRRELQAGPSEVTQALRLPDGAEVIRLDRLRFYDGAPVLFERIWLDAARFRPVLTMEEDQPQLLYPIYEALCGAVVAYTEEEITIGAAEAPDAELLGMELGAPMVLISRTAYGYDDCPIEWRCSRGPASDFRYRVIIR